MATSSQPLTALIQKRVQSSRKETAHMKVLLIDDSSIMRMMLKSLLSQVKLTEVIEAANGNEGMQVLSRESIGLILLDLHMPEMDGVAFLSQLRRTQQWSGIPVIVVSSDADTEQMEEAKRLGACAYVTKPFRIEGLAEALRTAFPGQDVTA
ncbi:MAG: response regulator [Chitinivibrionales bacterium]|nr:response regulator [Chitinivibrionales bacterium]